MAKHEQALRQPGIPLLKASLIRLRLFLIYIQYACVHSFTLLFMHPSKSFVALYDPKPNGMWQRSYVEHVAYRNRIRFASVTGFLTLLTATAATFAIAVVVLPGNGIEPALAATYTVNSNNNTDDGTCNAAHCSLVEAINAANSNAGADTITFSGSMTISPVSPLPQITDNNTTISGGGLVTLDGVGGSLSGLSLNADYITVKGLTITNFPSNGITFGTGADNLVIGGTAAGEANYLYKNTGSGIGTGSGSNNTISLNYIGQKADGSVSLNGAGGIAASSQTNLTVGGTTSAFSYIVDGMSCVSCTTLTVQSTVVGLTSTGLVGNAPRSGILVAGGSDITIGGAAAGTGNYIAGMGGNGIGINSSSSSVTIKGNTLGLKTDNVTAAQNSGHGIVAQESSGVVIDSNTIDNNTSNGIYIQNVTSGTNQITLNVIGVVPSTSAAAGNTSVGIGVQKGNGFVMSGNTIGRNGFGGMNINGLKNSLITGNFIGMNSSSVAIPNVGTGLTLDGDLTGTGVSNNALGRNFISGNTGNGLEVLPSAVGATAAYNYIGLSKDGTVAVPNGGDGVIVQGSATLDSNVISGNKGNGVTLNGTSAALVSNDIGVAADGVTAMPNLGVGVRVNGVASATSIGKVGQGNIISGNTLAGIALDTASNGVSIAYNYIGVSKDGSVAVSNGDRGVVVQGTSTSLTGNVISGNTSAQIDVTSGSASTSITDNFISTNPTGTTLIDGGDSIQLTGASSTTITGNVIGGTGSQAISLSSSTTGSSITDNLVGVGSGGSDISGTAETGIVVTDSDTQTIGTVEAGNTIANFVYGIVIDGSDAVSVRGNAIYNNSDSPIFLKNGANGGILAPTITSVSSSKVSGTAGGAGTVDVFQDSSGSQAKIYIGSATAADDGTWFLTGTFDTSLSTSATYTDSSGNTSLMGVFSSTDTTPPVSVATPSGGTFALPQTVVLTVTDDTDTSPIIYYTTDGYTPTTDSLVFSTNLTFNATTTLKFFAVDASGNTETVHTEGYVIQQKTSETFSPSNIAVKESGGTPIHPDCSTCTVTIEDTTPTFIGSIKKTFLDYIVRLVVFAVAADSTDQTALEKVFTKEKAIAIDPKDSSLGFWKITIPEEKKLSIGEYVVNIGLKDSDGNVVKPATKHLSLAVAPASPVVVSPQPLVYLKTPQFTGNALNDTEVVVYVFQDNVELAHCKASVVNDLSGTGSFSCSLPFDLKPGQYVAHVNTKDLTSGLSSTPTEVTFVVSKPKPAKDNVPFSLVPDQLSIQEFSTTTDNTPVFVGLAANDTEVILVIDGKHLFTAKLVNDPSGVGHWYGTTSYLAEGMHSVYAIVRANGVEVNRTDTLKFKIVTPTVTPLIISPKTNAHIILNANILYTVLGHSGDTVTLTLTGPATMSVQGTFSADPSGTGKVVFTFDKGLPLGTWTAVAVAMDAAGKTSEPSKSVVIRSVIPIVTTPTSTQPDTNTGNTNNTNNTNGEPTTNTNQEPVSNTNQEPSTNTNNTKEHPVSNTNQEPIANTNEQPVTNTNQEPVSNTNQEPSTNTNTTTNTNQEPTPTPGERTPLPEPPAAYVYPSADENFPVIKFNPEPITSDKQKKSVKENLQKYITSSIQILPVEQEENNSYLVTTTTVDHQPLLNVSKAIGLSGSGNLTKGINAVLRLFGFGELKQTDQVLIFRGTTIPFATVVLTIHSEPIVKIAQADADGRWTMTVPADTLPPGEHVAELQTQYAGVSSDQVEIARFVVVQQERLSNTTWLFIVNLAIVLVVLLAAIFMQLRKRTQLLQAAQNIHLPANSPWKSGSVTLPPSNEKKTNTPKGPDDLGDIMGI